MNPAYEAVVAACLTNQAELEQVATIDQELHFSGKPYGCPERQSARKKLDFLIDRQADLDKTFKLMNFGSLN